MRQLKSRWPKEGEGKKRWVYEYGDENSPVIVLLHELPGVTESLKTLAAELADAGYRVLAPELLPPWGNVNLVTICLTRQFAVFAGGRSSPIADWLGRLCSEAEAESSRPVAVIGMCATGGIVLSLLWRAPVAAGVIAQPSLPLRRGHRTMTLCELGCTTDEARKSADSGKPVLVFRFEGDKLCPKGRVDRLEDLMEASGKADKLELHEFPGKKHSTLTIHRDCAHTGKKSSVDLLKDWLSTNHPVSTHGTPSPPVHPS